MCHNKLALVFVLFLRRIMMEELGEIRRVDLFRDRMGRANKDIFKQLVFQVGSTMMSKLVRSERSMVYDLINSLPARSH